MDNRAIGIFDSGLGGLTAVKELRKVLPNEKILYFGDTGRVPYGTRSAQTIAKYAKQDINFLLKQNVKMIVAACGTVSSNAKQVLDGIPILHTNILEPCCEAALKATKNNKIGIIATSATINSGSFDAILKKNNSNLEVYSVACPLLVTLVENGFVETSDELARLAVKRYLEPLKEKNVDTIILGCTHFPILKRIIGDVVGEDVKLINSGKEIAYSCAEILKKNDLLCEEKSQMGEFFVSDSVQDFNKIAKICLGSEIKEKITKIDIEKY